MAAGDDEVSNKPPEDAGVEAPKSAVVTQHKHNAPTAEPPQADEFGLPVKPPRRRNFSLGELESPAEIRERIVEESKVQRPAVSGEVGESDGVENGHIFAEQQATTEDEHAKRADVEDHRPSSSHVPHDQPAGATSEWSHQQLAPQAEGEDEGVFAGEWQEMPALAQHRIYDDWGKVVAKGYEEVDDNKVKYNNLGGAGKGYTRVQVDDDAQSATSMDENTAYLFKDQYARNALDEEDDEGRDVLSQMQTTKELLTEAQRIAYVGVVRLSINQMALELDKLEKTKGSKKNVELASEALKMWGQKMMVRVYKHMDIATNEQVMVEQLGDHGVLPSDLTHSLRQNARVKNPKMASETSSLSSARPSVSTTRPTSASEKHSSSTSLSVPLTPGTPEPAPPPAYEEHTADQLTIQDASELTGKSIDLDLRWTVLCDLFLLLIADGSYDARSRTLLELVGAALSLDWREICRFEKRITDALEMQEQADKENWNEDEHMKSREKAARNKRLMVMGLCTVGGGLVIGLSAGMLAPVIGAGLAAGFTGIGIAGTGGFLGGTGAAALIGTTGTLVGGSIGMKTSDRRTGAVKEFEYRPLFNNKRVNLIVTVSGWMTGNVDDVRLPFSTVDPIMGDIYSVNWEPEMLKSTGQTIQILGTEALTQTIQQILGATFLATLMAGLSLPIVLTKLSYLIDNPWTVSLARADSTGLILADSLIDRNLGARPITLVGFSLGSRVIFSCLRELARRGAVGLIQNVYMFGSPVVVKKDEWTKARTIVSGRFVNGYATNDWILAYLFRATSGGIMRVAGLATVDLPGIENIDVTETVPGHMAYRGMMPTLLDQVGWAVESVEFSEIEDPDPDNHEKRQRELLNEIEEARREMEAKPEKKGFKSFFTRRKAPQRKAWETYDERSQKGLQGTDVGESERVAGGNSNVMFDVDAIQKEALRLALEGGDVDEIKGHLQIREIESTMPALKIASPTAAEPSTGSPLGRSQTHDGLTRQNGQPARLNGHTTPSKGSPDVTNGFDSPDLQFENDGPATPSQQTPDRPSSRPTSANDKPDGVLTPHHQPDDRQSTSSSPARDRPVLRSVNTLPTHASSHQSPATGGHNPWAEQEEEEGLGQAEEVEMSFE